MNFEQLENTLKSLEEREQTFNASRRNLLAGTEENISSSIQSLVNRYGLEGLRATFCGRSGDDAGVMLHILDDGEWQNAEKDWFTPGLDDDLEKLGDVLASLSDYLGWNDKMIEILSAR